LTEERLIGLLKQGDPESFRHLLEHYSDRVYNTALGLVNNREDAEDLAQEVFTEVFRSIGQFKQRSKLSTWIYRITVTKSLEFLRGKSRKKRSAVIQSLFGKEQQISVSADDPFYHPGVSLEKKEMAAILFGAMKRLPETQRTAFTLSKLEHLSYAEIADVMEVSVSSVESLLFRAKQNLQKILAVYYEENLG
jgi:RNA polymerase sigma factor (sigma-70 family)